MHAREREAAGGLLDRSRTNCRETSCDFLTKRARITRRNTTIRRIFRERNRRRKREKEGKRKRDMVKKREAAR